MPNGFLTRYGALLLPACFLLSVFTLFFFPVLFEGNTFFFRDIHHFAYPMKLYLAKVWAQGGWPYWYPNLFQGIPLMSLMHPGVFYPPSILFLLRDFSFAFNAYFLFHHLVLMGSVYALCRYWGRSVPASLCAALTALLGGYFLSLSAVYNQFQSAIWLPLILLLWQKFLVSGRPQYFCGAVVFLVFQVLGGGPENAIFSVALVYAHSLYLGENDARLKKFKHKTLAMFALAGAALALSAVQCLPTYYLLKETGRGGGLSFDASTVWSLEPKALLNLFLPENFAYFLAQDGGNMSYFVHSFYMGIVPLFVLFGCLLIGKEQRAIRFWLMVFAVGVFFALGEFNPLYFLFHKWVPVFDLFRYPQKFFFFCAYALVFLSAWGLDRFVYAITHEKAAVKKLLLALLATALVVAGMFGAHSDRDGLETLMILLVLAGGIFFLQAKKINGFFSLLLLLMVMDLMGKNAMLVPLIDRQFYTDPPPLAQRLKGTADSYRVFSGMLLEKPERKKTVATKTKLKPKTTRYNLLSVQLATRDQVYPNLGAIYDLAYADGLATMMLESSHIWYDSFIFSDIPKKRRVLARSNVKYWVTEDFEQLPSPEYPRGIKKVKVFGNVLPRAFLVGGSRVVPEAKLLDTYYDSAFDPRAQVLLTEPVEIEKVQNFFGRVEKIEYSPNRVTLKTSQSDAGFLVLLDTYFPGWQVRVDGQPDTIHRANYFYRGVKLSAGHHVVEFSYIPEGFPIGLRISFLALVCLVAGPLFYRFRNS